MRFNRLPHLFAWIDQRWRDLPLSFKGIGVIALPLLVLLASLASLYMREQASALLEKKLEIAMQNQHKIQTVHTLLLAASTGVRDYLLTNDPQFLKVFYVAQDQLPITLALLDQQLEDEAQKQGLSTIKPLALQSLHELNHMTHLHPDLDRAQLVANFRAQLNTLDLLSTQIEDLSTQEAQLVAHNQQALIKQRQHNIALTLLAAVAGIIGSLAAVWVYSRTIVKRVRLLRDSAGYLAKAQAPKLPAGSRDELGQLSNELDHAWQLLTKQMDDTMRARQQAEDASTAKSMFLSRTSHELRTPLNAILGFAQLLQEDLNPGKQRDNAALIANAGQHLLKLINEVLEIAKVESGELNLQLAPVAISPLLEESVRLMAHIGKLRDIEIQTKIAPNLWAQANAQKLLQVVLNLLSNAIKYGPAGNVVTLSADARNHKIVIGVEDQGLGILPVLKPRLFTPFDRLGAEHSKIEGSGLGLALSKQLMLAMQGSIHVADNKSVFWIELAACAPVEQTRLIDANYAAQTEESTAKLYRILYLQNDPTQRALIEAIIARKRDTHMYCVNTFEDAQTLLHSNQPWLVMIDYDSSQAAGQRLLAYMKGNPPFANIAIMLLSSNAHTIYPTGFKQLNVLRKPLDVGLFNKMLRAVKQD